MLKPKFKIGDKLTTYRVETWNTRPPVKDEGFGRQYFDFIVTDIIFGQISGEPYYRDENGKRYGEDICTLKEKNGTD